MKIVITILSLTLLLRASSGVEMAVNVNGGSSDVRAGLPLLIAATIVSDSQLEPTWAEALVPTLTRADSGDAVIIPVLRSTRTQGATGRLLWTVAPDVTSAMQPGLYSLHLGEATAFLRISIQPAESSEQQETEALLLARWNAIDGRAREAINALESWIAAHEASIGALLLKADLHEAEGEISQAVEVVARAIRLSPASGEGPVLLLRRQSELLAK